MDNPTKQALLLKQGLDQQADFLVRLAEKALPDERMQQLKGKLGLAQFNNLIGVALESGSPLVVSNWLRYQMGRKESNVRMWRESGLGDQVVKTIEQGMKDSVEGIAMYAYGEPSPDQLRVVHIALVRRYLGYLKRWYVAKGGQT